MVVPRIARLVGTIYMQTFAINKPETTNSLINVTDLLRVLAFIPPDADVKQITASQRKSITEVQVTPLSPERHLLHFICKIYVLIFFSVRERAEFNKSCNLIGSGSGWNFPTC